MKLLFDQNLSPRLPQLFADLFPGSAHVRQIGLRDADDSIIWDHARQNGFAIISKDSDFQFRSLLYGSPPKFIWCASAIVPSKPSRIFCATTPPTSSLSTLTPPKPI